VGLSLAFRLACYGVMVWLALWNESRPAPSLPDVVLQYIPYVAWVDHYNYWLWIVAYVPVALWLLKIDAHRFVRYMVTSGLVALVRGLCIAATGLGPVHGPDLNAGITFVTRVENWRQLMGLGFFNPEAGARLYLTKDLFFSGHTATTFLLLLYVWKFPSLRRAMLVAHVLTVCAVFLAHLHYTIDVIGAWAVTYAIFSWRERR
jgi:hypothetical protein